MINGLEKTKSKQSFETAGCDTTNLAVNIFAKCPWSISCLLGSAPPPEDTCSAPPPERNPGSTPTN